MSWSLICPFFVFEFCYFDCSENRVYLCPYLKDCNGYAEQNAALDRGSSGAGIRSCDEGEASLLEYLHMPPKGSRNK